MDSPTTPYREGKPLSEIIPPDRRRRRTMTLIVASMITGAALWVVGGALVETVSFAADSSSATPASQPKQPNVTAAKRSAVTTSRASRPGTALEAAIEAAMEGRAADVRRLLEAKVRSGQGSPEEVRLVRKACAAPFDMACIEDMKAKYP